MKIVIVDTTNHEPPIGGGHTYLPGLMSGLIKKGHIVHLVVYDTPNEILINPIKESGVTVHKRPWGKTGLIEDSTPVFADWINTTIQPDIYLISGSYDIGWTVLPLLNSSIATLMIGHNDSETFYLPVRHYQPFLTKVIGVSDEICRHYTDDCHADKAKVEWIPYGVEVADNPPEKNGTDLLKIVYAGRVVEEQKRISDVFAIVKSLSAKNINFNLTIIGDGPQMPELKKELEHEIKTGRVHLTGWLKNHQVIEILRQSEIFLLTSAYEGFCIALVESMANGCTPVVSDIASGNKQLIDNGANGFLIEIGNIEAFTNKLVFLAENRDALFELRKQAWKRGQQFSFSAMINAYENCFIRAVKAAIEQPRKIDASFPLMSTTQSKYPYWLRKIKLAVTNKN